MHAQTDIRTLVCAYSPITPLACVLGEDPRSGYFNAHWASGLVPRLEQVLPGPSRYHAQLGEPIG
eukprot:938691-Alexandrium_andersonii.AAC.1